MWIVSTCVLVLLATWFIRTNKARPLDRKDINRVRRFSEKIRREELFPLE